MVLNNLPLFSNRNLGGKTTPDSTSKAQNFSVSRLNSRKDIDEAKVSISRVGQVQKSTTSINRAINPANNISTSVSHTNVENNSNEYNQEEADDKRYDYIRRLAMARKKERDLAGQKDDYDLGIKAGALFREKGRLSLKRRLARLQKTKPTEFRNLGKEDRAYFDSLVSKYARKIKAGNDFSIRMKRQMTMEVEKKRRAGEITSADSYDMKKIIKNLPHS